MNEKTLIIGFCILTVFYVINRFRNRYNLSRYKNEPPLVHYKYPIIGHSWDCISDTENFLLKCRQEYGEIFSIYVYGKVLTVVGKELSHEVFNSKNASFTTAFEEKVPIRRILGLFPDWLNIAADISKNVFSGQMHLFTKRIQQSMYKDIDELIGECNEPKVIRSPRQIILMIISRAVNNILVGEELCRDEVLVDIFMNFSDELSKLLQVPEYLGYIHPWIFQQRLMMKFKFGNNHIKKQQKIIIEKIKPIVEARLDQERKYGNAWKPPVDCIQYLLSQSYINKDDVDYVLISGQLLGITFASITTTVNAAIDFLLDFASKPEYWNDLLEEQEKVNPNNDKEIDLDQVSKMVKLDSFLKESLRLSGSILGITHKVVGPEFKFSNGYQIPKGRNIGIYLRNVHEDKESYGPDPDKFDGYRYLGNSPAHQVSRNFIQFGLGRHACPGRNFAVNEIKIFISILIKKYKITTESGKRPPSIFFRGIAFPNPEPLIFEKRGNP